MVGYHCCQMHIGPFSNLTLGTVLPVITAVAGYVGGILSEPIKKRLMLRQERELLRQGLYSELCRNLESCFFFILDLHQPRPTWAGRYPYVKNWERREVFDKALNEQPLLFHQIKESKPLTQFYLGISLLKNLAEDKQIEAIKNLSSYLGANINDGTLSYKQIRKRTEFMPSDVKNRTSVVSRIYHYLTSRNIPKATTMVYEPSNTIWLKVRAMVAGVPGKPRDISSLLPPSPPRP
jgi:hypothetical protein